MRDLMLVPYPVESGLHVHRTDIDWVVNFQVGHPLLPTRCQGTESEHYQGPHPAGPGLH